MIIVKIFKNNAHNFSGVTVANSFTVYKKQLRLYFPNVDKVSKRISNGEIIDTPYATFQKDRRLNKKDVRVSNERRRPNQGHQDRP